MYFVHKYIVERISLRNREYLELLVLLLCSVETMNNQSLYLLHTYYAIFLSKIKKQFAPRNFTRRFFT